MKKNLMKDKTHENISFINYSDEIFAELQDFWIRTGVGGKHRGDSPGIIKSSLSSGGKLIIMTGPEDNIIGSAWLTTDMRRTYLHYFAIEEKFRGKGLSKVLMEKVIQHGKYLGLQMRLEVHTSNIPARELYKKYGFKYLGDYDIYINRKLQKDIS